jgi:hypothetical protein
LPSAFSPLGIQRIRKHIAAVDEGIPMSSLGKRKFERVYSGFGFPELVNERVPVVEVAIDGDCFTAFCPKEKARGFTVVGENFIRTELSVIEIGNIDDRDFCSGRCIDACSRVKWIHRPGPVDDEPVHKRLGPGKGHRIREDKDPLLVAVKRMQFGVALMGEGRQNDAIRP